MQASAFFGQIFRKLLPDAAEPTYDLDASNLSISCESEEPISSYFGRGSSLQNEFFFASAVADDDADGESAKLLVNRMAEAEGVSTSRSAAMSGHAFTLWNRTQ